MHRVWPSSRRGSDAPAPTLSGVVQHQPRPPSALLVVGLAALFVGLVAGAVAWLVLGPVAGLVVLVASAGATAAIGWTCSGAVVLRLAGGEGPGLTEAGPARLANLVESVSAAVGIPTPALRVVQDPAPNALVTGPDARRATLVVTSGLLERLDRMALEAVVAQQLSMIREGRTRRRDVVVAIVGTGGRAVPALARLAARAAAAGEGADVASLAVTRYPPGLLSALELVAAGPEVRTSPVLVPLWFVPPGSSDQLTLRLETMRELV